MTDLIARIVARLLCSLLFPVDRRHRAALAPEPVRTPDVQPPSLAPENKSPYARAAAEGRRFTDTISPVRPYVLVPPSRRPDDPERQAQAERRWALDMCARGIDVGPTVIHGVHLQPGARAHRVAVGA
ncbi:hypothetical protein AB0I84_14315 [Streptomyces spectabilis]|uniref:hypothetical protein n=1 Tax=Streptomyces spectabilis TaxID=68270 RepID=UPI0033E82F50